MCVGGASDPVVLAAAEMFLHAVERCISKEEMDVVLKAVFKCAGSCPTNEGINKD